MVDPFIALPAHVELRAERPVVVFALGALALAQVTNAQRDDASANEHDKRGQPVAASQRQQQAAQAQPQGGVTDGNQGLQ